MLKRKYSEIKPGILWGLSGYSSHKAMGSSCRKGHLSFTSWGWGCGADGIRRETENCLTVTENQCILKIDPGNYKGNTWAWNTSLNCYYFLEIKSSTSMSACFNVALRVPFWHITRMVGYGGEFIRLGICLYFMTPCRLSVKLKPKCFENSYYFSVPKSL
jgi:hypothetical protein